MDLAIMNCVFCGENKSANANVSVCFCASVPFPVPVPVPVCSCITKKVFECLSVWNCPWMWRGGTSVSYLQGRRETDRTAAKRVADVKTHARTQIYTFENP